MLTKVNKIQKVRAFKYPGSWLSTGGLDKEAVNRNEYHLKTVSFERPYLFPITAQNSPKNTARNGPKKADTSRLSTNAIQIIRMDQK